MPRRPKVKRPLTIADLPAPSTNRWVIRRKAKSTVSANGAENVFVMVQGKLKGAEIVECGLVAQVKTPKRSVEAG